MLEKLKLILNLWDPYKINLFPDDEYFFYADKINFFIINEKDLTEEKLIEFIYKILPPIDCANDINIKSCKNEVVLKTEYVRCAKVIINIILNK